MAARVTVIGLGCEIDRLFEGQRPALPVPGPPERDDLRDLFETLAAPLRSRRGGDRRGRRLAPAETLSRVRTIHSLLETDRVAIHVTHLPPLAASVLAALTAAWRRGRVRRAPWPARWRRSATSSWCSPGRGRWPACATPRSRCCTMRGPPAMVVVRHRVQPESFVQPITRAGHEPPLSPPPQAIELLVAPGENAELDWIVHRWRPRWAARGSGRFRPPARSRVVGHLAPGRGRGGADQSGVGRAGDAARELFACAWCREAIAVLAVPVLRRRHSERDPQVRADAARLTGST